MSADPRDIAGQFEIEGTFLEAVPQTSGHINDTFVGKFQTPRGITCYIHQRINHLVFRQPEQVMDNVERVTRYARQQIGAAGGNPNRETLTLVPARDGQFFYKTAEGETWRTYLFIERARTYEYSSNPQHIYHAARAFGSFIKMLAGLPGPRLYETIPGFHYTPNRFAAFQQAVQADEKNRARECREEIEFLLQREADASVVVDLLKSGALPERVTHNDTKLNNVLIDDQSGAGICVIDLDTTMPGSTLYDFGDLIRMGAATAAEDEADLSKVGLDLEKFGWLSRGFLDAAGDFLTPLEWQHLAFGGKLITYEQSMRFLGDYLRGDVYYKTHRPGQNLDRARNQIKMVRDMENKREEMEAILAQCR